MAVTHRVEDRRTRAPAGEQTIQRALLFSSRCHERTDGALNWLLERRARQSLSYHA